MHRPRERWLRGERPEAESYLKIYRESQPRSEYAVDILYSEFLLRHQFGEVHRRRSIGSVSRTASTSCETRSACRVPWDIPRPLPTERVSAI
jgi:hypothetical protein